MLKKLRSTIQEISNRQDTAGELYKSLFEESHAIMLLINPDNGAIIDANASACAFYQYPRHELLALTIYDINTLSAEQIQTEMHNAKTTKRTYFNFQHRLANDVVRDVEVYSSPIVIGDKEVLYSIIHDVTERLQLSREREKMYTELEKAQRELKRLEGILPLCSFCKKIRDPEGSWHQVDEYIHEHSGADVSHTVCPECRRRHYPEFSK